MMKNILLILCIFTFLSGSISNVFATNSAQSSPYTDLREVDLWTFNEYKYRLTEQFFILRNDFEVFWAVQESTIIEIYRIAKDSYNYLPDNLVNKNLYAKLEIALARIATYRANESIYLELIEALDNYLDDVSILSIKWSVEATPDIGNAPLSTTLRGNVRDESGTQIPAYNYIWWVDEGWQRKVIWNKPSIHYVFTEEWTFSVFLDVTSAHKNANWYTDVLPFRSRADIVVREKVASLIIKVNSDRLRDSDELKFTPEEASYGLIFDATSSTATDWARFTRTEWDFWNGVESITNWDPEIERVKFTSEWEYTVSLTLRTNENKTVERSFTVNIHDPIATINASQEQWFLWDKFTFSAKPTGSDDNLNFDWEIIDIDLDQEILTKNGKTFTYSFPKKWKYNVRLRVTEPSWEVDIDTEIIYINSRAPVAEFSYRVPNNHEPNTVLLDASTSYDLDWVDDGKLVYEWVIDGTIVELNNANFNWSVWYYTFDSIESHSVLLRVTDPEWISHQITKKVPVKSILSVDFAAYPRVTQREFPINFQADSPEARVFAWNFWDGTTIGWRNPNISHTYKQSGIYTVQLQVSDDDDKVNTYEKKVYIWESNRPVAYINVTNTQWNEIETQPGVCYWEDAYIVDRAWSVNFGASESIDVTWKSSWLTYSWKLGTNKFFSNASFSQKFDELGCSPIQLTVKSNSQGQTDKVNSWIKVENLKPTLSSVDVQIVDLDADPVVVKVSALWSKDPDGVIQSYLWYYYTDIDPEPQDFRATKLANTTFVLPKVTWNYYFVVLMKDNNETRVSSEDITGSKYFITLTWDNINVPLVELNVNDSSISVGEEVIFTTEVENILWYDLSNKAEYSWDLDGDGFYEEKTNTPNVAYTYKKSGEFYAKVKAKYKWYSNTKSITINVSNLLNPEIEYISIGNKFVLLDTSIWKTDSITWDLWDWNTVVNNHVFTHEFEWNKGSYDISLELKEWIKTEKETFNIQKNVRNLITARKTGLIIFSNKEINENIIQLSKEEKVFLYLWESKTDTVNELTDFSIDTNIEYDSNLNGGKNDDKDIIFSYWKDDNIVEITLDDTKNQTIKITAFDISWNTLYTQELLITKEYINDQEIDINSIEFVWVTQSELVTIEELKSEIQKLPQEHRLKSMLYVQKLQEEWFDVAEKTKTIVEFEGYISWIESSNSDIIYSLLEELLLEWDDDKSEKNLMFIALKNLTPTNIDCNLSTNIEGEKCYNAIIQRLELININSNIDENKALAIEILEVIEVYPDMLNSDKNNFKAILSSFIYWGVDNIPEKEKNEEIAKPNPSSEDVWENQNGIINVLKIILFIFLIIIWLFAGIFIVFFLIYKVTNKDDNIGFQDFIIEKTSGHKKKIIVQKDDTEDILKELDADLWKKDEKIQPKKENLSTAKSDSNRQDLNKDPLLSIDWDKQDKKITTSKEEVPAWLKWNFSEEEKVKQPWDNQNTIKQGNNTKGTEINKSINKQGVNKDKLNKKDDINSNKSDITKVNTSSSSNKSNNQFNNDANKKIETKKDDWDIPNWLKGSFVEDEKTDQKPTLENKVETKIIEEKKTNNSKFSTKSNNTDAKIAKVQADEKIPDWLKWAIDNEPKKEENIVKTGEDKKKKIVDNTNQQSNIPKMDTKEDLEKITDIKEGQKEKNTDIPDWLKGTLDEEKPSKEKNNRKEKVDPSKWSKDLESSIPDWLKWSLDEKNTSENNKESDTLIVENKENKSEIKQWIDNGSNKNISEKTLENKWKKIDITEDNKTETNDDKISVTAMKDTDISKKTEWKTKITIENNKAEKKVKNTEEWILKKTDKNSNVIKTSPEKIEKSSEKKIDNQKEKTIIPKDESNSEKLKTKVTKKITKETTVKEKAIIAKTKKTEDELWDDGMKIPDWLQTDDDK